jgi:NAD(P)-dependent dehydrogenase (short-subunit alcohol dehydrogenase family)
VGLLQLQLGRILGKVRRSAMRRAGGGSIIITSSVAGLRGICRVAGYYATKGGVRLFAKAVAMECAAESDGIRVNTVHPGVIDTPIWTKLSGSGGRNVPIDPNEVAKAGVPLGRAGQAQDIANGVLFLARTLPAFWLKGLKKPASCCK